MSEVLEDVYCSSKLSTYERTLNNCEVSKEYTISRINTNDIDLENFLFSLGCYSGEHIVIVSALAENYVVLVKDARYSINEELAESILVS